MPRKPSAETALLSNARQFVESAFTAAGGKQPSKEAMDLAAKKIVQALSLVLKDPS